jgi:tetratricopeptide (TPR) repeat protein
MLIGSVMVTSVLAVRFARNTSLAAPAQAGAGATYAGAVAELDAQVAASLTRLDRYPNAWIDLERAAAVHHARGQLCNRWGDWAVADSLLARAFEVAPSGAGPFLTRARLNCTLHRFDRVEDDLRRAEAQLSLSARTRTEIDALRSDVALATGRIAEAVAAFESLVQRTRDFESLCRLAGGVAATGETEHADALYAEAASLLPRSAARLRAWVWLQRGLLALENDALDEALLRFRAADAAFPGWWLVEEHIAEVHARRGEAEEALAIYASVLGRTWDPEFMDAVARVFRDRGDDASAAQWISAAKRGHAERIARFPEAAHGHAAAHEREFGKVST